MLLLTELLDKNGGFLLNDEFKIVVKLKILEVIGKLDVLEKTSSVIETIDIDGFHVLPSQVALVKRLLEKHPDNATNVNMENQYLKTGYMNVLLGVTGILRRSFKEIFNKDLADAYATIKSMISVGYKLDWLVKKLNRYRVAKMKAKEEAGEARMQKIEEELKDLKRKRSDLEAELEEGSAESESDDDADEDSVKRI